MNLKNIFPYFSKRWPVEGGYRQILFLALPLILSSASMAIQQFVDRMFLAWYSAEAIAATMPAGILNFTVINLFIGTAGYVGTFVAQYWGAKQYRQIGPIVWQGIYISIIAGIIHVFFIPLADPVFKAIGHSPEIQRLEVIYFQIICLGAMPNVAISVLSGFFTGRGKTRPVMVVTISGNILNMILNYILIFGHFGFPEMGVKGAAIATLISSFFTLALFLFLLFGRGYEERYQIFSSWRFNIKRFMRLLRFGLPSGIQYFVLYLGISIFILLVGRLGITELAAVSISFNINMLAFMPMIGLSMAVMILVGQYQGKECPDLSEFSVFSGLHLTGIYMFSISSAYFLVPGFFIWPFASNADPVSFGPIKEIIIVLLRFIALYSLFDTMNMVFSSGIKGAGDTKFVMIMEFLFSVFLLAIPTYIVLNVLNLGIYAAFGVLTFYIIIMSFAFLFRFLGGKWKSMRVIEKSYLSEK